MERREFLRAGVVAAGSSLLPHSAQAGAPLPVKTRRILVWSENTAPPAVYPDDIRGAVAGALSKIRGCEVQTRTLSDPGSGRFTS